MSSGPPPKEGEVLTSSTKVRQLINRLKQIETEVSQVRAQLYEILEASGY